MNVLDHCPSRIRWAEKQRSTKHHVNEGTRNNQPITSRRYPPMKHTSIHPARLVNSITCSNDACRETMECSRLGVSKHWPVMFRFVSFCFVLCRAVPVNGWMGDGRTAEEAEWGEENSGWRFLDVLWYLSSHCSMYSALFWGCLCESVWVSGWVFVLYPSVIAFADAVMGSVVGRGVGCMVAPTWLCDWWEAGGRETLQGHGSFDNWLWLTFERGVMEGMVMRRLFEGMEEPGAEMAVCMLWWCPL